MLRRLLVVGCALACLGAGELALPCSARAAGPAVPGELRLVNYYPARNGWTYMWSRWDPAQIDRDFALIAGLNANAVRVIVQPRAFGYPHPTPAALGRLDRVFELAAAHGLAVQLTLFDWWSSYRQIAKSKTWARDLLGRYAGDGRLVAVELRNELEPRDPHAVAWARTMLPYLRTVLPAVPLTLSVGANDAVHQLTVLQQALGASRPDFWSFHYYDKPELAYGVFAEAKAAVAPTPLFIGETGYHPGDSDPPVQTQADRYDEQLRYFRTIAAATTMLGLPPAAPWILLDFAPGGSPVRMKAPEYSFGLFRSDGTPKPAAEAVRAAFGIAQPNGTAQPDAQFNGGFEQDGAWRRRGAASFVRDTTVFHGGASSLSVSGIDGRPTFRASVSTTPPEPWVVAGQTLTLSAWVRGENATGTTQISLRYYDGGRNHLAQGDSLPLPEGTTDWTQVTLRTIVPQTAAYVRIILTSDGNRGRVWFDDVTLARS